MQREEKSKSVQDSSHIYCIEKTKTSETTCSMHEKVYFTYSPTLYATPMVTEEKAETVGCEENESGGAPAVIQLCQSAIAAFYTRGSRAEIGPLD